MQATQPAFFKQGPKPLTRLLIFSTLSIALMIGDAQLQMLGRVREQVALVLYPLQWLATTPVAALHSARDFLSLQAELIAENRKLNDELLVAQAKALRLEGLAAENAHLRELAVRRQQTPSLLAEILYSGRDPFSAKLIVDLGENHQVKPGQIAIDTRGVVGQVVRTQAMTSEVRLITDRNHMVPVMNLRSQLRTVVYGRGAGQPLEVRYLAPNADIRPGDVLVTSGLDGTYPAGLPVATVQSVERPAGSAFPRILCRPAADIDHHRFLLLLDPPPALPGAPAPTPTSAS